MYSINLIHYSDTVTVRITAHDYSLITRDYLCHGVNSIF